MEGQEQIWRISTIAFTSLATAAIAIFVSRRKQHNVEIDKKNKISALRQAREKSIDWAKRTVGIVSENKRKEIQALDYTRLKDALQIGEVKAVEALCAYLELALDAHRKTNCVFQFLEDSLEKAEELDHEYHDKVERPEFFGFPLSVKSSVPIAGHVSWWGGLSPVPRCKFTTPIIAAACKQGAIPFVLTSVPTGCIAYCTVNAVTGATTNPHGSNRSPGGSSGGEAALVGAGGSLLGVGSDLGGSIRLPSSYTGAVGFKPTSQRFMLAYPFPLILVPYVFPTDGPIASTVAGCVDMIRLALTDKELLYYDCTTPPLSWNNADFNTTRRYRIGYFTTLTDVRPFPSQVRVVYEAKQVLEENGYELVPFEIENVDHLFHMLQKAYFFHPKMDLTSLISEKDAVPNCYAKHSALQKPSAWNQIKTLLGFPVAFEARNTEEVFKLRHAYLEMRQQFQDKMRAAGIDALLSPASTTPALTSELPVEIDFRAFFFTSLYNLLDYPAGVLEVDKYKPLDAEEMKNYIPRNPHEEKLKYDCEGMLGLPLSVQIAAPTFRDEIVLNIMTNLEKQTAKRSQ